MFIPDFMELNKTIIEELKSKDDNITSLIQRLSS